MKIIVLHVNDGLCPICDEDASMGGTHKDNCIAHGYYPEFAQYAGWVTIIDSVSIMCPGLVGIEYVFNFVLCHKRGKEDAYLDGTFQKFIGVLHRAFPDQYPIEERSTGLCLKKEVKPSKEVLDLFLELVRCENKLNDIFAKTEFHILSEKEKQL